MRTAASLRMRLTLIILLPLLLVAAAAGLWQLNNARGTAAEVFDKSLLSAALAVASDVAISEGDALSPRTRDILSDTSGGQVFYHVYAPDGVIVAGYATPPVGIPRPETELTGPVYFEAVYLGRDVSGVRLQNRTEIEGFAGTFTTTVWQDNAVRAAFVRDLIMRTATTISALILALALIVWFGVRIGLRPLMDLESAIAQRSSDELNAIQRAVPHEVQGIVTTLNRLFEQVSKSMTAQNDFISNAAHQLRNPIAGVLSLAEAVHAAPNGEEAKKRSEDLLDAARETADLSQQLLTLERAKSISPKSFHESVALGETLENWVDGYRGSANGDIKISFEGSSDLGTLRCDPTMLREALRNLMDNAVRHGGPKVDQIEVAAQRDSDQILISVIDNGLGLSEVGRGAAMERFKQVAPTSGSGLGVSIVDAVARGHGGTFKLVPLESGLRAEISLPVS